MELCFGQRIDTELGILEPWYTNPAMDRIKTWDLKDKVIMEWGMGSSTKWWATKSKLVLGVDHNIDWYNHVNLDLTSSGLISKTNIGFVQTHEGDQSENRDNYICHYDKVNSLIKNNTDFNLVGKIDIAIVDGIHRYECAEYAVKVLKPQIIIIDNYQQDYVFICPKLDELLVKGETYKAKEVYAQENHTDHSGNCWKTAIFYL